MNERRIKDVTASIRQRLYTLAQSSQRPFQEVLQHFAMERFLYRLSRSAHARRFVLKGALAFRTWHAVASRPTRDIDLLGRMPNDVESVVAAIRDACRQVVEPDGLEFAPDSVVGDAIREHAEYAGVRVTFRGSLHNVRLPMQIDVGFGDVAFPPPVMAEFPTLLGHASPALPTYSRETVVAEKFETMVKLGLPNSRMKDFYDVMLLSRRFDFVGGTLASAIQATFARRGTTVDPQPTALSTVFATDPQKIAQWRAFLRKSRLDDAPVELREAIHALATFLSPPATAVIDGREFLAVWQAPGPWQSAAT